MARPFEVVALSSALSQVPLLAASSRAGALGVLDLDDATDPGDVVTALGKLEQGGVRRRGVMLDGSAEHILAQVPTGALSALDTIILTRGPRAALRDRVAMFRGHGVRVVVSATSVEDAELAEALGADAVIAKGHEAGGWVGDETTFILLQRLLARGALPVWAHGGLGLHGIAACYAAGAAGVVLDWQLVLLRESRLPEHMRAAVARMDGSETACLGGDLGAGYRVYARPRLPVVDELRAVEQRLEQDAEPRAELMQTWRREVRARLGGDAPERSLWPMGQDAALAGGFAKRFRGAAALVHGIDEVIASHCRTAQELRPLDEGSPLARSHGTRFPILQGPMTRVSDSAEFAERVADEGGLPFLALALMRGDQVRTLLEETRRRVGDRPWGVGILGFVPLELRQEQLEAVHAVRPPFALIAGGRPDQALSLEQLGIPTYLHVPSPALLSMFIESGAQRFVFEGRECGGHVGPRSSLVLWELMIEVLLDRVPAGPEAERYHVIFAAGIHDALSASMVATMAAPLAERGIRIGVLLGTAYLFTREAVEHGAIVKSFQDEALACARTMLLETGPGHSTRCVETPYGEVFRSEKRRLLARRDVTPDEMRNALEALNLGRLRIASKGIARNAQQTADPGASKFVQLTEEEQRLEGMYMIGQVAALRERVGTIAELHRDVSVGGSERLARIEAPSPSSSREPDPRPCDIAIVGMACLLPKAPGLAGYWQNILGKVDAITEIPPERWDWRRYYDPDPSAPDKIYSKWGGFIDKIAFDPLRYGMPPSTLPSIEPVQLLALEVARAALADAGYADRPFPRERTGVVLGAGGGAGSLGQQYAVRSNLPTYVGDSPEAIWKQLPEWTEDSFAGILLNVIAGRVANRFDLGGVNYTVDAACASSLAAVYAGVRELEAGTADMMLVGGADTVQNPFAYLSFSKTRALSPRGRCQPFDVGADGIVISEGVAMLVLKRLADAERDGDRIYAVIKSVAGSSDGRDRGLTAPRPEGQVRALERAYAAAGFTPDTVELVEAHGTGTVAGDRAEIESLIRVWSQAGATAQSCAVGSVKSMIGHIKCAAGMAGLLKVALALHHRVLPPTLNIDKPNPAFDARSPLYPNTEARPWLGRHDGLPRRAGVSSFGFGGTNFHVVLEEHPEDPVSAGLEHWPSELFLWAGDSASDIAAQLGATEQALAGGALPGLRDLAYSAWQATKDRRASGSALQMLAIVATTDDDLAAKIRTAREGLAAGQTSLDDPRGIYWSAAPLARDGRVAFVFSGQGSQQVDMLRGLTVIFTELRESFARADRALAAQLPRRLSDYVFPPPRFSETESRARQEALTQTNVAQAALGAAGVGLMKLLAAFGVTPALVAGHSYGEYVALHAAGVIDEETLYTLSEARGRVIIDSSHEDLGGMAAVQADPERVAAMLRGLPGVWISNLNAPGQTMISGTREALREAIGRLDPAGLRARPVPVACAFHSPLMAAARDAFARRLATVRMAPPRIDVFANTTAAPHSQDPAAIAVLLTDHLVKPVRFSEQIENMYLAGARIFVEVGPGTVLANLVQQNLQGRGYAVVSPGASNRLATLPLHQALAQLAAHGVAVNLDRLFEGRQPRANAADDAAKPSTWFVDGSRAWPAGREAPKPATPVFVSEAQPPAAALGRPPQQPSIPEVAAPAPGPEVAAPARPELPPAVIAGDGSADVMRQFQALMNRFLETQRSVMLAYLGSSPAPAGAEAPSAPAAEEPREADRSSAISEPVTTSARVPDPGAARLEIAPAATPAGSNGSVHAGSKSETSTRQRLTDGLRQVVSERTGYPVEMLELGLNMEADLGIDSIKRVEILGAFQRACLPAYEQGARGALMERLTEVKTIGGVIDVVLEALESVQPSLPTVTRAASEPAGAPGAAGGGVPVNGSARSPKASRVTREQLTQGLRQVVSERTGYPAEMLELGLNMEADLGIDSIKRVEILGAFQRTCLPAYEQGARGALMERLTEVKTIGGIVDVVLAALEPEAHPTPATAGPPSADVIVPATNGHARGGGHPIEADTAPGAPTRERLTQGLRQVVSERTGYPAEMLELGLNMEADLGIDSIKRVEILGAFQRTCLPAYEQGARGALMERLTEVKTIGGIIDVVLESVQSPVSAAPAAAAVVTTVPEHEATDDEVHVPRSLLSAIETPLVDLPELPVGERPLVITDDRRGVARVVSEMLRSHRVPCILVSQAARLQKEAADHYVGDLTTAAGVHELIAALHRERGPLRGLVHLLPLRERVGLADLDQAGWRRDLALDVESLFHLVKTIGPDVKNDPGTDGMVIAATSLGGQFASDGPPKAVHPSHGGVAGLVKTLAIEWPGVRCKVVDFPGAEDLHVIAGHLLQEMTASDGRVEVGYRDGRRFLLFPRPAPLPDRPQATISIDESWVLLVTGGARGITAEMACDLASRYRPILVLAGRSPLPSGDEPAETAGLTEGALKRALIEQARRSERTVSPARIEAAYARLLHEREARRTMARLGAAGARVRYEQVDVRDEPAFGDLIDRIYAEYGRLDGVIHGAGVIEDKLVSDKTPESFQRVLSTKADSAFVLMRKLRPEQTKLVVFFSSVASRFGNRGQSDYAAANEVVNKLAIHLDREWATRVVALNWGPWKKAGMVSAEVERQFEERGVQIIPPAAGCRVADAEIRLGAKGECEVVLGGGRWEEAPMAGTPSATLPLLRNVVSKPAKSGAIEIVHRLDPARHVYLQDHRIDGKPVLPMAMAMELVAEVAQHSWPDWQVTGLRSVRLMRGIVLDNGPKNLRVVARPQAQSVDGSELSVDVEILDDDAALPPFYRATVNLSHGGSVVPDGRWPTLPDLDPFPMPVNQAYRQWLFHGPVFQGIVKIEGVNGGWASALVEPSQPGECVIGADNGAWLIDPVAVDCGFQLAILWSRLRHDMTPLPMKIGSYHRVGTPSGGPLRCLLHAESDDGGTTLLKHFYFSEPDGRMVGVIENMESTCSRALNRLGGTALVEGR